MDILVIWILGTSLAALILVRAALTGKLNKYPLFYLYIGCVLLTDILSLVCYQFAPKLYRPLYWPTELITIIASYAVVVDIFRQSLRHNSGIARKGQKLLFAAFALTVSYAATDLLHGQFADATRAIAEVGRDLRYIEGALLLLLLWLFLRYRILLGPNLLGLIIGYSFWVGLNVINLALVFLPDNQFSVLARRLEPITYVATLTIWCVALWSSRPEPVQPIEGAIERDYDLLAAKTRSILVRTSNRFVKVMRP
jgi:hypothetical protein